MRGLLALTPPLYAALTPRPPVMSLAIYLELERMGFKAWYDNRADDVTKEGMRRGIQGSAAFILFLSQGVLTRPFVQVCERIAFFLVRLTLFFHHCSVV